MKIIERHVQVAIHGNWDEAMAHEARWAEADAQYGAQPKRRYMAITGAHALETYVWEREWASMATMEQHYEKQMQDPALQPLMETSGRLWEKNTIEYYIPVD